MENKLNKEKNKEINDQELNNVNGGYIGKIYLENTETGDVTEYEFSGNTDRDKTVINTFYDAADAHNKPSKSFFKKIFGKR